MEVKTKKKKELSPIDCSNDEMMVGLGIRPPHIDLNKNVFVKTKDEKELVKKLRRIQGLSTANSIHRDIHRKPKCSLVVYLKNGKHPQECKKEDHKFKNKYVYTCAEHEISTIMEAFHPKDTIVKLTFNGKEIRYERK